MKTVTILIHFLVCSYGIHHLRCPRLLTCYNSTLVVRWKLPLDSKAVTPSFISLKKLVLKKCSVLYGKLHFVISYKVGENANTKQTDHHHKKLYMIVLKTFILSRRWTMYVPTNIHDRGFVDAVSIPYRTGSAFLSCNFSSTS